MDRWKGRVAVVTGASSGIGYAIAKDLVKAGFKVVALARRKDILDDLRSELVGEMGELHPFQCDVTKVEDIQAAFEYVNTKLNGVDVLVNNAGMSVACSILEGPINNFKAIYDTNLLGLTICTHEAYQSMKAKGINDGYIVNINSVSGHNVVYNQPLKTLSVYSASKFGVTAINEGLRLELLDEQSNIRVTSISPALVSTEIFKASGAPQQAIEKCSKLPCLQPEDISNAVLYVLSTPPHVQISELTIRPVGSIA